MITIRKSEERGHLNHGWLDTYHSFSFGSYMDPRQMGFRSLRVINEDRVAQGEGFGTHPHADMEILTWVLEGELAHKDSMGNVETLRPYEIQAMSAGTGIRHSEFNGSAENPVHLLQIWILPERRGLTPRYEEKKVSRESLKDSLRKLAAYQPQNGEVKIFQDADLYASELSGGKQLEHTFEAGRYGWLQLVRGTLEVNGAKLKPGDGAAISGEQKLTIRAGEDAHFLLFDLA